MAAVKREEEVEIEAAGRFGQEPDGPLSEAAPLKLLTGHYALGRTDRRRSMIYGQFAPCSLGPTTNPLPIIPALLAGRNNLVDDHCADVALPC